MVKVVDTKSSKSTTSTSTSTIIIPPLNTPQRIRNAWKKIKLRKPKRIILRFCCCYCNEEELNDITVELKNCTLVIKTFTKLKEMQSFINQLSSDSGSSSSSSVYNTLTVMFIYSNNSNNSDKNLLSWFKYCYFYLLEKKLSSFSFPMIVVEGDSAEVDSAEEIVKSFVYEYDLLYENLLLNGLYIWNGPLIDSTSNGREKIILGNVLVSSNEDVPFHQNCLNVFYTSTSKKSRGSGCGFKVMEIVKNITNTKEKELFKEYMKDKEGGGEGWNVEFRGELGLTASDGELLLLLLCRLRVPLVKLEVEDDPEEDQEEEEEEEEDVLYFLLELKEQQQKQKVLLFDMKLLKLQQQQQQQPQQPSKSNSPYDLLCGLSSGLLSRVHENSLDFDMESMLREYTDATEQNIKEIIGYYKQKEEVQEEEEELFSEKEQEEKVIEEEEEEEEPAGLVENVKEEENVFMMEEEKELVAPTITTKPKRISNLKLAKMRRQKAMKE